MVLSIAIAIPIPGLRSLARFAWTLGFRLKALHDLVRGRIGGEEYRVARSVHSVPVMLLALVPVFGAIAYAVSGPMVKKHGPGRLLVDQAATKLPFGLYRRLGMARFTTPRPPQASATRERRPEQLATMDGTVVHGIRGPILAGAARSSRIQRPVRCWDSNAPAFQPGAIPLSVSTKGSSSACRRRTPIPSQKGPPTSTAVVASTGEFAVRGLRTRKRQRNEDDSLKPSRGPPGP